VAVRPLEGLSVALLVPDDSARRWLAVFERSGARVVQVSPLVFLPPESWDELDGLLTSPIARSVWAFSSPRAVRAVAGRPGVDLTDCRIAVVGPRTREVCEQHGWQVEGEASPATAEGLVELLLGWDAARVVFPRGDRASSTVVDRLCEARIPVFDPVVYRTVPGLSERGKARLIQQLPHLDWLVFTSPSGWEAVRKVGALRRRPGLRWAAVGPTTGVAIRESGWWDGVIADRPEPAAVVEAIARIREAR